MGWGFIPLDRKTQWTIFTYFSHLKSYLLKIQELIFWLILNFLSSSNSWHLGIDVVKRINNYRYKHEKLKRKSTWNKNNLSKIHLALTAVPSKISSLPNFTFIRWPMIVQNSWLHFSGCCDTGTSSPFQNQCVHFSSCQRCSLTRDHSWVPF